MTRVRRLFVGVLAAAGALLLIAGCGTSARPVDFTARAVDPPFKVDSDVLRSSAGDEVSLGADPDAKRLRLVFFGYTHCPDICPTVLGSLASGVARLAPKERAQVQVYFVTTDPARDTAKVLRRYVARFGQGFEGLAAPLDRTARIAKSVGIFVDAGSAESRAGYDPNAHSTYVVAVGRDGRAPAFWNAETSPSEFASDIRVLLTGAS